MFRKVKTNFDDFLNSNGSFVNEILEIFLKELNLFYCFLCSQLQDLQKSTKITTSNISKWQFELDRAIEIFERTCRLFMNKIQLVK